MGKKGDSCERHCKSVACEITSTQVTMLLYSGGMVREVFVWAADTMIVGADEKASGNLKV